MLTIAEENYLKCIFKRSEKSAEAVATNTIAEAMHTKAASVTDMLRKLSDKELVHYQKYRGVRLTDQGAQVAKRLLRSHRLWEVFLVDKLDFTWDEVHELAEELEHIRSDKLMEKLDKYLGYPQYDPHGDPIPDKHGNINYPSQTTLKELLEGDTGIVVGVLDSSVPFLQYLDKVKIELGTTVAVIHHFDFDGAVQCRIGQRELTMSEQVARNLYIRKKTATA